jgi:hypothetical protein
MDCSGDVAGVDVDIDKLAFEKALKALRVLLELLPLLTLADSSEDMVMETSLLGLEVV